MENRKSKNWRLLCVSIAFALAIILVASMQHIGVLMSPNKTASFEVTNTQTSRIGGQELTSDGNTRPKVSTQSWTESGNYDIGFVQKAQGTKESPYVIDTAKELAGFNWLITHGSTQNKEYLSAYYQLKNEFDSVTNLGLLPAIDMGANLWNPVGDYLLSGSGEMSIFFTGTFDGNGRTIDNLVMTNNNGNGNIGSRVGFFAKLGDGAVVKNTVFDNAISTLSILTEDDSIEKDLTMGIIAAETSDNSKVQIINNYIHRAAIHTQHAEFETFEYGIKAGFVVGWQGKDDSQLTIEKVDIRLSQMSINNVVDKTGWSIEPTEVTSSIGGFVGEARTIDIKNSSVDGIIGVESIRVDNDMDNWRFIFAVGGAVGLLDNSTGQENASKFENLDISGGMYVDTFSHELNTRNSRSNKNTRGDAPWVADVRYLGGLIGTANLGGNGDIVIDNAQVSFIVDAPNADTVVGLGGDQDKSNNQDMNNSTDDDTIEVPAQTQKAQTQKSLTQKEKQELSSKVNTTKNQKDLSEFFEKRETTHKNITNPNNKTIDNNNKTNSSTNSRQTRSDVPGGEEVYIPLAVVSPGIIAGMAYVVFAALASVFYQASIVWAFGTSAVFAVLSVGLWAVVMVVSVVVVVVVIILAILFGYWAATKPEYKSYVSVGAAVGSKGRQGIKVNNVHTAITAISKSEVFSQEQIAENVKDSKNFLPVQASIVEEPKDIEITELGQTAKLEVQANGVYNTEISDADKQFTTLEYQWYYNVEDKNYDGIALEDGDNISGATTSELTVEVDYVGYRYYYCVVNNKTLAFEWPAPSTTGYAGSKNTLPPLPIVTKQPQDAETASGVPASFEVIGEVGVGKLYYQWFISKTGSSAKDNKDGMAILGATDKEFRAVQREAGEYYYYVALTNKMDDYTNATFSEVAKLTVQAKSNAPTITKQPNSSQVLQGSVASMSIEVDLESFNGKISYQWYRSYGANTIEGSEKLEGQTSQVLNIRDTTEVGKRFYFVEATNTVTDADGVETKASTLSELGQVDIIQAVAGIIQKIEFNFTKGEGVYEVGHKGTEIVAAVQTSNGDTLSYQWYSSKVASSEGGIAIANATNASLSFTEQKEGVYYYYVVVTIKNSSSEFAQNSVASQSVSVVVKNSKEMSVKMTKTESDGNIDLMADVNRTAKDGAIQFQWYRSLNKDGSDAQVIDKAWGSVLRVSALGTRAQVDSYYYFVTVDTTSTNSHTAVKAKAQNIASIVNANSKKSKAGLIIALTSVFIAILVALLITLMIMASNSKKEEYKYI